MKKGIKILNTYWFVFGLIILLLNDFVFKDLYGNWFTGKLSDFVGLFIFSLFFVAIIPKYKAQIFIIIGLLFILFKSPFSQSLIDFWNNNGLLTITRVVDITDLIALLVLPFAYYLLSNNNQYKTIKIPVTIPLVIASFAFMATSYQNSSELNKEYEFNISKDSLKQNLENVNKDNYILKIKRDTVEMRISYSMCEEKITVVLVFKELSKDKTKLILVKAFHRCKNEKDYNNDIINAFDSLIINKLNTIDYIKTNSENYLIKYDFDGDGKSDEIIANYSGGGHCCYTIGLKLSTNDTIINYPFKIDGGYIFGLDNSKPDNFFIKDYDKDSLPEIFIKIESYNGKKSEIPKEWTTQYGIKTNSIILDVIDENIIISDFIDTVKSEK